MRSKNHFEYIPIYWHHKMAVHSIEICTKNRKWIYTKWLKLHVRFMLYLQIVYFVEISKGFIMLSFFDDNVFVEILLNGHNNEFWASRWDTCKISISSIVRPLECNFFCGYIVHNVNNFSPSIFRYAREFQYPPKTFIFSLIQKYF